MKEVEFRDRVPTNPGRVRIVHVSGDLYDMERADNPTETGTALNKVTFDSIVKSRLTGRYYAPSLTREVSVSRTGLTSNPLPTSGWVFDEGSTSKARNSLYIVESSSDQAAYSLVDELFTGGWQSANTSEAWVKIYHAQAIKVRAMKFSVKFRYAARFQEMKIQGSNNGTNWTTLLTTSVVYEAETEYTLTSPGEYEYYRLLFTFTDSNNVTVGNFKYSLYDVLAYNSAFTVDGFPSVWTTGQRVMISTPASINSFAVISNTLNGVTVNTILQPNKRYELRYTGSAFAAKEV